MIRREISFVMLMLLLMYYVNQYVYRFKMLLKFHVNPYVYRF
jgi:hypothetical protein